MPADRTITVNTKLSHRSAVANGTRLFVEGLDGRSALARRYRDLLATFAADMGGDPSEAQKQLIRRAASLSVWCEAVEVKLANGEDVEISQLTTATNSLRRILQDIGFERATKDVTPSIEQYMEYRADAKRGAR
ncbi:MAG: hypothetical protein IR164_06420 [Devosia sp.]|uniref:hypothetical protein n=1 Tax=Devosia sp. TaxID=1871048 RepID=UPI0019E83B20|nr:hypothetical protein [Devosia sp.]MBF0678554.1 hypothetical protein [Devosia sp.]